MLYISNKMKKTAACVCVFLLIFSLFLLSIHGFLPHNTHNMTGKHPTCTICVLGELINLALLPVTVFAAFIEFGERSLLQKPHHTSSHTDMSFPMLC